MGEERFFFYRSPVGLLRLKAEGGYLTGLIVARDVAQMEGCGLVGERPVRAAGGKDGMEPARKEPDGPDQPEDLVLRETVRQLDEYFAGKRRDFSIPIKTHGTDFQERVWKALRAIPYGETRTYGQIAAQVGNPKASRAVGGANHNNPILILTPCHRVIGADGSLTGFGGGLDVKEALLALEKTGAKAEG